jgi:hypothetical protein
MWAHGLFTSLNYHQTLVLVPRSKTGILELLNYLFLSFADFNGGFG